MRLTLLVREVVRVTPRTVLLRLDLAGQAFLFEAGQAVLAGLAGRDARKPYAIACAPTLAARLNVLELLVQVDPASPEPHLEDVTAGSLLDVEGPFGSVILPPAADDGPLLLIAGGTGIAPLRSILWEAVLRAGPVGPVGPDGPDIVLAYSARTRDEFAFIEELSALEEAGRLRLYLTTTREPDGEGRHGRLDAAFLQEVLPAPDARCYVCGPDAFIRDMTDILMSLRVPTNRFARD